MCVVVILLVHVAEVLFIITLTNQISCMYPTCKLSWFQISLMTAVKMLLMNFIMMSKETLNYWSCIVLV